MTQRKTIPSMDSGLEKNEGELMDPEMESAMAMDKEDTRVFFVNSREIAVATYANNPRDADNLQRWGTALSELSDFQNPAESKKIMIKDAIEKFEEALSVSPTKHEVFWCLGKALTKQAHLILDSDDAKVHFYKAYLHFKQAVDMDPSNLLYCDSLRRASEQLKGIAGSSSSACTEAGKSLSPMHTTELPMDLDKIEGVQIEKKRKFEEASKENVSNADHGPNAGDPGME